jgi:hypothetical protein
LPNIQEESAWDACIGILYQLLSGPLANGSIDNEEIDLRLLDLLLRDYARRSSALPDAIRTEFNAIVVGFLADVPPQRLLAGLGRTLGVTAQTEPSPLDVGVVVSSSEELRATALAFDAEARRSHEVGDPAEVIALDCAHLAERRLLVGLFPAEDAQTGELRALVAHMRHRRLPRLVCLVGSAASASKNASLFDVVVPGVVYRMNAAEASAEIDLSVAESLGVRDAHLYGLEAYDPAHTAYRDRLRALLKRVPRQYKAGLNSRLITPRFDARNCIAVSGIREGFAQEGDDVEPGTERQVCILDSSAYEFAESLPSESWLIFRGIAEWAVGDRQDARTRYLAALAAALCLRDFLENYYVPPGAAEL